MLKIMGSVPLGYLRTCFFLLDCPSLPSTHTVYLGKLQMEEKTNRLLQSPGASLAVTQNLVSSLTFWVAQDDRN